jgi:hypothetical protein
MRQSVKQSCSHRRARGCRRSTPQSRAGQCVLKGAEAVQNWLAGRTHASRPA